MAKSAEDFEPGNKDIKRRIPLEGAVNFRDLGGYENGDGSCIRPGQVYRSDSLAKLTPQDLDRLRALGIQLVCDFRADAEIASAPDILPADGSIEYLHLPVVNSDFDTVAAMKRIREGDISWLTDTFMRDGYIRNIDDHPWTWAQVLERLAHADNRPLVFHCTAGKDRTGICAALLMRILGIPRKTIVADHQLSNRFFAETLVKINQYLESLGIDPEKLKPYLTAPLDAITAALDHLESKYGSAEAYLVGAAGMDPVVLEKLRRELLVPGALFDTDG